MVHLHSFSVSLRHVCFLWCRYRKSSGAPETVPGQPDKSRRADPEEQCGQSVCHPGQPAFPSTSWYEKKFKADCFDTLVTDKQRGSCLLTQMCESSTMATETWGLSLFAVSLPKVLIYENKHEGRMCKLADKLWPMCSNILGCFHMRRNCCCLANPRYTYKEEEKTLDSSARLRLFMFTAVQCVSASLSNASMDNGVQYAFF